MDSLGKLADIFIMILVLFIIPVGWGLKQSENSGELWINNTVQEFMDSIITGDFISEEQFHSFARTISLTEMFSARIAVKRSGETTDINTYLADSPSGRYIFRFRDIITIWIEDKKGTLYSFVKVFS